jgi:hypothetical protein
VAFESLYENGAKTGSPDYIGGYQSLVNVEGHGLLAFYLDIDGDSSQINSTAISHQPNCS